MPINMNDPRTRKTRQGLRDALIRLILRQGYDSTTIEDISREADTARATIYRHYGDKEALLMDCLNTLYEHLVQRTERVSAERLRQGISPVKILYEHIEAEEALYRVLFSSRGSSVVIERMRHHLASHAMAGLELFIAQHALVAPVDVLAHHVASAQMGLAIWWLDQGKPYPADYMAQISVWLSLAGLLRAVGVPGFDLPVPPLATTKGAARRKKGRG